MKNFRHVSLAFSFAAVLVLTGCGTTSITKTTTPVTSSGVTGLVHGGQQPVANAMIQLYAVGTTGDGSASTPLLTKTVTTDVGGNFTITNDYSCTNATEVYITATGGNPGVANGSNPNLALMTALGPCSSLNAGTVISINELTTVAATSALAPYMTSLTAVGSASTDTSALASAFTLASEFVDPATGYSPGQNVPAGYTVPTAEIDTLADVVASCVNSTGGAAGDNSACGQLFNLTTLSYQPAPANTIAALLNVAYLPTQNVTALFNLAAATAPFQPVLAAVPANFAVALQPDAGNPPLATPLSLSFGQVGVGTLSTPQTVTTVPIGSSGIPEGIGASITGNDAGDFSLTFTDECSSGTSSGEACPIVIVAKPQAVGPRSAQLFLNVENTYQYIPLFVIGVAEDTAPLTLSATSLSWTIGGTYQDLSLENFGNTPVTIYSITEQDTGSSGGGSIDFAPTSNCGSSLAAQSVCTVSVESTGMVEWGNGGNPGIYTENLYNGTLSIMDSASAWPQLVALSSANTQGVSVPAFSYVQVGTNAVGTATADAGSYYETSNVDVSSIAGANAADFSAPNGGCEGTPSGAGGGETCTFEVDFKPSASGPRTAKLELGGNQYVLLTGNGVAAGPFFATSASSLSIVQALPASPDPYSLYGNTVTLTNYGTTTVAVAGSFTGPNAGLMSVNTSACGTLAPSATCIVTLGVAGTTPATDTATLLLKDTNSTFSVSLPVTASLSYWPIAIFGVNGNTQFGNVAVGSTGAPVTFTVGDLNDYTVDHAITLALQPSSNFVLPQGSTCAASPTQVCTLTVAFAPQVTGNISEYLTATDTFTGLTTKAQLIAFGGTPVVSLSSTSLTFPERANNSTSVPMSVTLTNTGAASLMVSSISVLGAVNGNFTQTNTCTTVAAGGNCTIYVTFAPTTTGSQSATIQILSNAPSSPDTIAVSGSAD